MTEEEIKAAEAAAEAAKQDQSVDAVISAWTRRPSVKIEDTPEGNADNEIVAEPKIEGLLQTGGHSGGVAETVRRAEHNRKLKEEYAAKQKAPEEIAAEDPAKKTEGEKEKPPVKFNLRQPKADQKVEPKDEPKIEPKADPIIKKEGELSPEDQAFVSTLPDEMQDSIDFWQTAESVDPDKYKGKLSAAVDYYKRYQAEVAKLKEDDEDFDPDTSSELRQWIASQADRPRASFRDQRQVLEASVDKKAEARQQEIDRRNQAERRISTEAPKIQQVISEFGDDIAADIPKEIMETITASGADAAAAMQAVSDEHGPEIAQAIQSTVDHNTDVAEAFVSLTRGVTSYDPSNPVHDAAISTVVALGKEMLENPEFEKLRTNDKGQSFMPREVFYHKDTTDEVRAKHFTFSEDRVLKMLAHRSKREMAERLASATEVVKRREARILKAHGIDLTKNNTADATADEDDPAPSRHNPGAKNEDKHSPLVERILSRRRNRTNN